MSNAASPYGAARMLRDSGAVKRWHITRLREQSVAAHSYGVACLAMLVAPNARAELLKAALVHDAHERATGDIPSTAKWRFPMLRDAVDDAQAQWEEQSGLDVVFKGLSEFERTVLYFSDYVELLMWSTEELVSGNDYAEEPITNIIRVLDSREMPNAIAASIYKDARNTALAVLNRRGLGHEFFRK